MKFKPYTLAAKFDWFAWRVWIVENGSATGRQTVLAAGDAEVEQHEDRKCCQPDTNVVVDA